MPPQPKKFHHCDFGLGRTFVYKLTCNEYLVMQRVGSTLCIELACANPAPITSAPRAVHVIATLRFVCDDAALRTLLTVLLDDRCGSLFNHSMTASPISA